MIGELKEARYTLEELYMALRCASPNRSGTLSEQVAKRMTDARDARLLRAVRQHLEQADHEQKYSARCSFCGRRLTPKGVARHERTCYKNPGAPQYGPDGEYEPVLDGKGQIVGYRRRGEGEGTGP